MGPFGRPVSRSTFPPQKDTLNCTCLISENTDLTLGDLSELSRMCQAFSWQSTTRASLNSQQSLFLKFCSKFGVTHFDQVTGDLLSAYAVWLVTSGHLQSVGSIRNYLSAVRTLCKMFGKTCHTPSSYPALEWTLTGIRRQ